MVKDRAHFEYVNTHFAISCKTGKILEFFSTRNYDNVLKNSMFKIAQPFELTVNCNGTETRVFPMTDSDVTNNPTTAVEIISEEKPDGLLVKVLYNTITDGVKFIPCNLFYTAYIRKEGVTFSICVESVEIGNLTEVKFPVLSGVQLGADYRDDVLLYPKYCGLKFVNPVEYFSREEVYADWRWLDYQYRNQLDGIPPCARFEKINARGFSDIYPGGLSMSWLDLYDADGGVYFGIHDAAAKPVRLEAATFGTKYPGLILNAAYSPKLKSGEKFVSPDCVISFHSGDWHDGADIYRTFRKPLINTDSDRYPDWLKNGAGMFAHYDFKYQTGEVNHKYADIPKLAKEAKDAGFNHMLFAGWQLGGHDGGIPLYCPDPDLGTEDELIDGIKKAKELGVHVTFYINFAQANIKYFTDELDERAVFNIDGEMKCSYFGNRSNKFANMCSGSASWKKYILQTVERLTDVYGADGIYFDVFACGTDECYNLRHNHAPDEWMKGKIDILQAVREMYFSKHGKQIALLGEWVCDLLGGEMSYQLNQLYWNVTCGGYSSMFIYTFPEFGITDMIYPKRQTMRGTHVSFASETFMAEHFTTGCYFWVYDLVDVNTFTKDPDGYKTLQKLIALRNEWLKRFPDSIFVDDCGLKCCCDGLTIRRFKLNSGSILAGFRLKDGIGIAEVEGAKSAYALTFDGGEKLLEVCDGKINLPQDKAFLILVNEK